MNERGALRSDADVLRIVEQYVDTVEPVVLCRVPAPLVEDGMAVWWVRQDYDEGVGDGAILGEGRSLSAALRDFCDRVEAQNG